MTNAQDIVDFAREWIGVPWYHQGRGTGPDRAIDCAGLLIVTAKNFDLDHGDMVGYRRDPGKAFLKHIKNHTSPAPHDESRWNGAIGIFDDTVMPCHCGILTTDRGQLTVVHSEAYPARRCHEEELEGAFKKRLIAVRFFKGVEYD